MRDLIEKNYKRGLWSDQMLDAMVAKGHITKEDALKWKREKAVKQEERRVK